MHGRKSQWSGTTEVPSSTPGHFIAISQIAAWYPTALLPTQVLRWAAIDDGRAEATLSDAGQSVSLEFRFNAAGEISGVYTPARWEKFKSGYRHTPWEGHFHNYERRANMLVPTRGEVGWYDASSWLKVWSGSVIESSYELMH